MTETKTNLRQAHTKATAVGLLTDKKLEIKTDPKQAKSILRELSLLRPVIRTL